MSTINPQIPTVNLSASTNQIRSGSPNPREQTTFIQATPNNPATPPSQPFLRRGTSVDLMRVGRDVTISVSIRLCNELMHRDPGHPLLQEGVSIILLSEKIPSK